MIVQMNLLQLDAITFSEVLLVWGFFGPDFSRTHEKQIEADHSQGLLSIYKIVFYLEFMILDSSSGASSKQIHTCGV